MSKQKEITLDTKLRYNPALRKGTWDRVESFGKKHNIDTASHATVLEKIIHDHCDLKSIPNPFDKVRKN